MLAQPPPKRYAFWCNGPSKRAVGGLPVQLRLSNRTVDGIMIVDCNGRIVFGEESASLRETLKQLITQHNRMLLNLGGVSYIDSVALGTLVALYKIGRASCRE